MGAFFEFTSGQGFSPETMTLETANLGNEIIYIAHDTYLKQLFAFEGNKFIAIRVTDFDKFPDAKVSWLSVSQLWITKVSQLPFIADNYFILSESVYDDLKSQAFGSNTIAFRLVKDLNDNQIAAYLVMGSYSDHEGGAGDGLLHGARVPAP